MPPDIFGELRSYLASCTPSEEGFSGLMERLEWYNSAICKGQEEVVGGYLETVMSKWPLGSRHHRVCARQSLPRMLHFVQHLEISPRHFPSLVERKDVSALCTLALRRGEGTVSPEDLYVLYKNPHFASLRHIVIPSAPWGPSKLYAIALASARPRSIVLEFLGEWIPFGTPVFQEYAKVYRRFSDHRVNITLGYNLTTKSICVNLNTYESQERES